MAQKAKPAGEMGDSAFVTVQRQPLGRQQVGGPRHGLFSFWRCLDHEIVGEAHDPRAARGERLVQAIR